MKIFPPMRREKQVTMRPQTCGAQIKGSRSPEPEARPEAWRQSDDAD